MKIDKVEFMRGIRGTDPILEDTKKQFAFAGRSNVGKSSVINALLGRKDMARSSSTPGKTTEINLFLVNDKFYFTDLPGYGFAKVSNVEKEKLVKMVLWFLLESGAPVPLVFVIVDASVGPTERDMEMIRALIENDVPYVVIGNKIDKVGKSGRAHHIGKLTAQFAPAPFVPFSAEKKIGIPEVLRMIEEKL
jgi:GTP-binding protein